MTAEEIAEIAVDTLQEPAVTIEQLQEQLQTVQETADTTAMAVEELINVVLGGEE